MIKSSGGYVMALRTTMGQFKSPVRSKSGPRLTWHFFFLLVLPCSAPNSQRRPIRHCRAGLWLARTHVVRARHPESEAAHSTVATALARNLTLSLSGSIVSRFYSRRRDSKAVLPMK